MPRASALVLLRAFTLLGLAATVALVVEYRSIDFAFCGAESSCTALRRTGVAHLWGLGVNLPEVGLLGVATVYALSLSRFRSLAALLAVVGGVAGLGFLIAQVVLQHFCWLCMTTDISAIIAGGAGVSLLRNRAALDAPSPLFSWAWVALSLLMIAAPWAWPKVRPMPPVPAVIRDYYRPGKINIVEFADFECPFCRNLHGRLKALLEPRGDRVNFVRLNMPLPSHPHARGAALAALCAEPSGKAHAMADWLFASEDIAPESIQRQAPLLGLDPVAFQRCVAAPETAKRLDDEIAVVKKAGMDGLPTTYVGGRRIVGAQPDETFEAAIERAAAGDDERGIPAWAYVLAVIAALAAIVRFGYGSGESNASPDANARGAT